MNTRSMRSFTQKGIRPFIPLPPEPGTQLSRYARSIRWMDTDQVQQDVEYFRKVDVPEYALAAEAELKRRGLAPKVVEVGGAE